MEGLHRCVGSYIRGLDPFTAVGHGVIGETRICSIVGAGLLLITPFPIDGIPERPAPRDRRAGDPPPATI